VAIEDGRQLLHYRILESLGKGGMGEVYLAEDTKLDRRVALKVLPPEVAGDSERRARFEREARSIAALNHPNIVTVHSVESAEGVHFITMEFVKGEPLSQKIPPDGLPLPKVLEFAVPLADALAAAHEKGITHRDLKPENVMITTDGRLKVLDFGLAKQAVRAVPDPDGETQAVGANLTREGRIVGTMSYMSPEQAEGRAVDPRSDVFSLGVMLYEMATGQRPFRGDTSLSTLSAILKDTPQPLHEVKPELPRAFDAILDRCLAKDPDGRFPSATDLRHELVELRDTAPSSHRSWWLPLLLVLVGLLAVTLIVREVAPEQTAPLAPDTAAHAIEDNRASVAVLPFVNMSADPENEYFSDGLAETLMHKLAQLRNLRVAARTSSFAFKNRNEDVRKIAEALNVSSILEGSVQKSGNQLRITTQLIDAATGSQLFSRKFNRTGDDVFAIQDEIAQEVVTALQVELLGGENDRLQTHDTQSVEAFNAYLLGLQRLNAQDWSELREALGYFERAVKLDPEYALAWARIAETYTWMSGTGLIGDAEATEAAIPAVDRALSIDPDLADALALRGSFLAQQGRRIVAAAEFARAMELNPDSSTSSLFYGIFLMSSLRYGEGVQVLQSAIGRDPLNILLQAILAVGHEGMGDFVEARRAIDRVREIDPHNARGYYGVACIERMAHGNLVQAVPWLLQAMQKDPEDYEISIRLVFIFLDLDDTANAKRYLDRALAAGPDGTRPRVAQVYYLHRTGRAEEAQQNARSLIEDQAFSHRGNSRAELLRIAAAGMDASSAADLYEQVFPAMRSRTSIADQSWNWPIQTALEFARAEVDHARLKLVLGARDAADALLDDAEDFTRAVPRMGRLGFGILDAEIAAVRGDEDRAMRKLRESVDAGWVANWWWELRHNPNLSSLHERADYQRIVEELESKMSRQRAELE
jgi:serine/threonine protein kinase/Tfp pilus assembly protein PilF